MRVSAHMLGLSAVLPLPPTGYPDCASVSGGKCIAPPSAGVGLDVAQQACETAKGTWDPSTPGCVLDLGPSLPGYCGWVPFATTLFSECVPPTAAELANYGSYTAYRTGQLATAAFTNPQGGPTGETGTGLDVEKQMVDQNQGNANALASEQDCSYTAAQNHPALAQIFGPTVTCMLADPFNSTSVFPGWILYGVLGLLGLLALRSIIK